MKPVVLLPNFCAEENANWRLLLRQPLYRRLTKLWHHLFRADATVKGLSDNVLQECHPLFRNASLPAVPGLPTDDAGFPWLMTESAAESLTNAGAKPWGPAPNVVTRVHDKAFAKQFASEHSLDPKAIHGLYRIFDSHELSDLPTFHQALRDTISSWPEWAQQRWTLKPRFGSSGRGRLPGTFLRVELPALPGAQARLIERGGVILEPFLHRDADISAQFFVHSADRIECLGTLRQKLSTSGSYEGHIGRITHDRVSAGTSVDDQMIAESSLLVKAAAMEGFAGPCGVDGFSFLLDGQTHLRSCVELNARFTVGTIVLGLLRRILSSRETPAWLREEANFTFYLSPPKKEIAVGEYLVPIIEEEGRPMSFMIFDRPSLDEAANR